ncbi:hypothetical protein BM536_002020 [Streptomyces phaeoluteigriseus]|uniref:Uncharacterized protein n=1 Tax=Streptomyces phaeoluteigriseus TaxID=114686 RepID=A0A1V6MYN3_9ACTN|nr:hypothetical protein BM536_002020 [Streptomyces phaeoluteigriseus]
MSQRALLFTGLRVEDIDDGVQRAMHGWWFAVVEEERTERGSGCVRHADLGPSTLQCAHKVDDVVERPLLHISESG